ncbi:MAG: glycosyltransferase, partial [Pseudonocardiales bacterium]
GRGHLGHFRSIAAHLEEPVTGLSSLPRPPSWTGGWLQLPRDDESLGPMDPTAYGSFHWAPLRDDGMRNRMAAVANWVNAAQPSVVVVDVSVEIATFTRLMGVPVVVMALPGDRADHAHQLAHQLATRIIAPWPAAFGQLDSSIETWRDRTVHVGGLSSLAGRPRTERRIGPTKRAVIVDGAGGARVTDLQVARAARATPGWEWQRIGPGAWCEDPWPVLCEADVVVTHAGLGAIADVAEARRPAVIVPQSRPYQEQMRTAEALGAQGLAVSIPGWPEASDWPGLLDAAQRRGGRGWARWTVGGAQRAGSAIMAAARGAQVAAGV